MTSFPFRWKVYQSIHQFRTRTLNSAVSRVFYHVIPDISGIYGREISYNIYFPISTLYIILLNGYPIKSSSRRAIESDRLQPWCPHRNKHVETSISTSILAEIRNDGDASAQIDATRKFGFSIIHQSRRYLFSSRWAYLFRIMELIPLPNGCLYFKALRAIASFFFP